MADRIVEYYLSLNSPWSFLGGGRLQSMTARHGARVDVRPIDAGKVFPISGGVPLPKRAPQRQAYRLVELDRWRRHLDLPLVLEPAHSPSPEREAALVVVAAARQGLDALALANAFGAAIWVEDRSFADAAVRAEIMANLGLDATGLEAAAAAPETARHYDTLTRCAIEAGVFGMPTYLYDGVMYWGQDRLDFLERALAAG